ncbi:MAG: 2-amino-4-hydroxy-6-hydroxymethyldihydropteridine diphosphokinase [Fibrobacteria bacterium]|nr:2-amino-4-hydroxy-6-hydroxymethyldihydropteridine diphosphokinase [Fibrobacteria bacterium]
MALLPSVTVHVALGSNLGDRLQALSRARCWLTRVALGGRLDESRIFETLAVGPGNQECHLNQIVRFETQIGPEQLLMFFKEVECWLGRRHRPRMHPREIDIDLLFYGSTDLNLPHLRVPHPGWAARSFVLVPLVDLDPDFRCPITGVPASALIEEHCPRWAEEAWPVTPAASYAIA